MTIYILERLRSQSSFFFFFFFFFFGINNIAILDIGKGDCCYIIFGISKNEAMNLLKNADLSEKKVDDFQIQKIYIFFLSNDQNGQ